MTCAPLVKLAGQLVAAIVTVALGLSLSELALVRRHGPARLGRPDPHRRLARRACANAVNLIDGLDGLAGGVSLATLLAFATDRPHA